MGIKSMWATVAPGWGEYAEYVEDRAAPLTARMLELALPRPGDRVLELACGAGGLGMAAAQLVAPGGAVVLSDGVDEMTSIAASRADALGLANVTTCVLDLDDIEQPDQSYDVVLCREALMFALDPAGAAREIRRVLRPGGRFAIAVWGPRRRNPWLGIVFDVVSAQIGAPLPPPGMPGPFSLEDADQLARLLSDAELADVVVSEFPVCTTAGTFDEWWSRTRALAGPLTGILASLPADGANALRSRLEDAVGPYRTPTGLEFPGVSLVASGRRP